MDYNHNQIDSMGRKRRRLSTTVAFSAWKATMKRMFHSRHKSKQTNNPLTMHSISLVGNYFQDQFERLSTIEGYTGPSDSVDDEDETDCTMMYHTVSSFNSLCDMSVTQPSISSTTTTPPCTPILSGDGRTLRNLFPNNSRFTDSCESLENYSRSNSSEQSTDGSGNSSSSSDECDGTISAVLSSMSLLPVPAPAYKVRTKVSYV